LTFDEARIQITEKLELESVSWENELYDLIPGNYGIDFEVLTGNSFSWIDWPTMSFQFNNVVLSFDVKFWSPYEITHGECNASGKGHFSCLNNIISIDDIEINLSRQEIAEPRYNGRYCINADKIYHNVKNKYPYPNDNEIAEWAGVTVQTVRDYSKPGRAVISHIEQLIEHSMSVENIADIMLAHFV